MFATCGQKLGIGVTFIDVANGSHGTVTSTEAIYIEGDATDQEITIRLGNGGFRPGYTNERGNSDEIEIYVTPGTGDDTLTIEGSSAANHIRLGVC